MSISVTPQDFLSADSCKAVFDKIVAMGTGGGRTHVSIVSQHAGSAQWANNRMYVASDTRAMDIYIRRSIRGANGASNTSRWDDEGLRQAVREAEASMQVGGEAAEQIQDPFIDEAILKPTLWSAETYAYGADQRTDLVQTLIADAEARGMVSAGNLNIAANGTATMNTDGMFRYYPQTVVECSITVRHPKGIASGWAGVNHYDIAKLSPRALATRALEKCIHSQNAVAIEPGRYTVILEPQATADLFRPIVDRAMNRVVAEQPAGPFGGDVPGRSKITEQVLDRRLTLRADPMDFEGGFLPYERYSGTPYQAVTWIDQGILKQLEYPKKYALSQLGLDKALPNPYSFCLAPVRGVATATIDDMISRTERGILVTRFSNVQLLDWNSMLCSGYTRDGLWLIERGKLAKPIKNLRFTESPLFAFNSLEDIGTPRRVFAPLLAHVAPAVRVRDFSFTGLADAV